MANTNRARAQLLLDEYDLYLASKQSQLTEQLHSPSPCGPSTTTLRLLRWFV